MRYWKLLTNQSFTETDPDMFRDDELYEAIDNLVDEFFPITISVISKREYMDDEYGKGEWSQEDWDEVGD